MLSPLLLSIGLAAAEDGQKQTPDLQFQSAVKHYQAGQFSEAATQLEGLLANAPKSFDVHELLGMVYAAESQNAKAVEHLEAAVLLKPDSAAARTNLATSLLHAGKIDQAGEQFRKALALEPENYDANHNLGEFYIQSGKIAEACPYLEHAQHIRPSYPNGYDLALAYSLTGQLSQARQLAQGLARENNTGELHNLLGQIEEKDKKYLAAANEFQTAAHMDPSEENLFDWGSELLLHQAYEPAIDVFGQAVQRYPNSSRLVMGLGIARYSAAKYEEAIQALLTGVDLNPSDPRSYYFLSKAYTISPHQAEDVIQRFRRYSELRPTNALAQYYYAMSLWKGKRAEDTSMDFHEVESLLQKAVMLDPELTEAHMQLGNLYAEQHEYAKSIPEYERALELNKNLPDAHYRLARDYARIGQKDRAQSEIAVYQQLRAQYMAKIDKESAEIKQFVYSAKNQ
jgi:predicted Zn-dependent protease